MTVISLICLFNLYRDGLTVLRDDGQVKFVLHADIQPADGALCTDEVVAAGRATWHQVGDRDRAVFDTAFDPLHPS